MTARSRRGSPTQWRAPTRVTYVVDSTGYGGAEIYLQHLLHGGIGRSRPALLIADPGMPALAVVARERGIPVAAFAPVRGKLDMLGLLRLARAIARTGADVVHVNMTTATNNRYAIAAAWLARVPAIATVHSPVAVGSRWHTLILRWLFARLRAVIAVSTGVRRLIVDDLRVPVGRTHLISNGVDTTAAVVARVASRVRIVAIGRLSPEKGFDVLVEAARLLVGRGVAIDVDIFGAGGEYSALQRAAGNLPVRMRGFVADRTALWQDADIFCLPSRFEGLPFVVLEAMMRGLPCVATDVGDVAMALGSAGIVVPADDPAALAGALALLANDATRRRELGAAARSRACAAYAVDAMVARTLDLCDAAACRAARRTGNQSAEG